MLTHLIHFAILDAFSAIVIWTLYSHISSNKDKTESTTVEQDSKQDDKEDDKPYHQTLYLDHGMTLLDWQRACEQAKRDYRRRLQDKRDFELFRDRAIYGDMYYDYESGQTFVYTKDGIIKVY